jgi:predicted transcriptional regulator
LIILHKIDDLFKMEIRNYITTDFKAIDSQETIATVKDFWWFDFSHFPVVEEGIYIGSISSEDIENFDDDKKVVDYKYTC